MDDVPSLCSSMTFPRLLTVWIKNVLTAKIIQLLQFFHGYYYCNDMCVKFHHNWYCDKYCLSKIERLQFACMTQDLLIFSHGFNMHLPHGCKKIPGNRFQLEVLRTCTYRRWSVCVCVCVCVCICVCLCVFMCVRSEREREKRGRERERSTSLDSNQRMSWDIEKLFQKKEDIFCLNF